jgi:hypothetical protein
MPLASREISNLTAENAVEVEERLKEVGYTVVSSCLSASSSERLAALRDSLAQFAKGDVEGEEISRRRIELFQALHRDLGRGDHYYLGPYDPQILEDLRMHRSIQE